MYQRLRPLLFRMSPETAHDVTLKSLKIANGSRLLGACLPKRVSDPVEVMGITFPNRVGLAAGLDKNGDYFPALGRLGFGFVEIGTVTPKAQPGNPKPRLFRIPEADAVINRMGFNNEGVDYLVQQVQRQRFDGVLGINIGKNKVTEEHKAIDDYVHCLQKVYAYADYITVNISSPNTPGLRDLQFGDALKTLLAGVKAEQLRLEKVYQRYVPIAVKIAPDMETSDLAGVAQTILDEGLDAVIATNTTLARDAVASYEHGNEAGGLSGAPLLTRSTEVIAELHHVLGDRLPIIGVGGISKPEDAVAKIEAGASLVQIYSGLIYQGPSLVSSSAQAICQMSAAK